MTCQDGPPEPVLASRAGLVMSVGDSLRPLAGPARAPSRARLVGAALVLVAAVVSVRALDGRFERADLANAERVVQAFRPPGQSETLPALIARAHGLDPSRLRWDARVTSSLYGYVRVTCDIPSPRPRVYRFDVDLGRVAIHPADSVTRRLLESLSPQTPGDHG